MNEASSTALFREINRGVVSLGRRLGLNRLPICDKVYTAILSLIERTLIPPAKEIEIAIQGGVRFIIDSSDTGSMRSMLIRGVYEPLQTKIFHALLRPGMTFVDVGAHVGYYSMLAARQVGPTGRVIAFEPRDYSFQYFERNIILNKFSNVCLFKNAVSDSEGEISFFRDSILNVHAIERSAETRVNAVALSQFLPKIGIDAVDIIKIDVEGGEIRALRGMGELIRKSPAPFLFVEFNPEWYGSQLDGGTQGFFQALSDANLQSLFIIDEHRGRLEPFDFRQNRTRMKSCNFLCARQVPGAVMSLTG